MDAATDETGMDEAGTNEAGTDEAGRDETGTDESGTDEAGTDEAGTDEAGAVETEIDEAGIVATGTDESEVSNDVSVPEIIVPEDDDREVELHSSELEDSSADSDAEEYNEAGNILALTMAFLFKG